MAGNLLRGAAIGAGFRELLRNCESVDTLNNLRPVIGEIEELNKQLDRPMHEVDRLTREMITGEELISKCPKPSWSKPWKVLSFPQRHDKVQAKDKSLVRSLTVDVQAQMARDLKESQLNVRNILEFLGKQSDGILVQGIYGAPEKPEFTLGLDEPLKNLKIELLKAGVSVNLLTGLGGSGKSTLAKMLCWDDEVKGKFGNNIFFVTVSETPNLKIIVQTLFENCGLLRPEFHNDEEAINQLGILLRVMGKSPILLVLDDVWPGSESVVENFKCKIPYYKILVTSRVAFPRLRFDTHFHLKPLGHEDAEKLFSHFAEVGDGNHVSEVVRGCKGSPLALKVIGNSLCGEGSEAWQEMKKSLRSNDPVNVHPLPLPPGAGLPSPSHNYSQALAKSDSLPMKSQWQKGKFIGRGTFGSVYVATNRETGALCALKEVELFPDDPKSAECIRQFEQEIKLLSQLKHPNIVQYYGSEIVEDRFYIYLEYVHPGSINKYVREHCGAITESVIQNFTRHILSGLAFLHSKKIIHRDIKGANLLVDSDEVVKLADFGMAKHLTGHVADLSLKGSAHWMAPELIRAVTQTDYSTDLAPAVDIWSLGCTIIEMFTGKPPWGEYEGIAAMFKVMTGTPVPIPETLSAEGRDFLSRCFERNPAERATAVALLEHRFLRNSQDIDVPSSSQLFSGMTSMDKPPSPGPRGNLENKPDQLPIPSAQIAKGKAIDRG